MSDKVMIPRVLAAHCRVDTVHCSADNVVSMILRH